MKHGKWMMLACILPILIVAVLPLLGVSLGKFSSLAFLICPLLHIGMMAFMMGSGKQSCHGSKEAVQGSQD